MSEVIQKLGCWTLVRVVKKSRLKYSPICRRCGYEAKEGELIWRHKSIRKNAVAKSFFVDYRCVNCFRKMWH
jgi:hypothetical protein